MKLKFDGSVTIDVPLSNLPSVARALRNGDTDALADAVTIIDLGADYERLD